MEKKLTNSGPLREPADKHSIYTMNMIGDRRGRLFGGESSVRGHGDKYVGRLPNQRGRKLGKPLKIAALMP